MDWGIAPAFVVESTGGVKVIEEGRVSFPVGAQRNVDKCSNV